MNTPQLRILVAHSGKQHSFHTAIGLKKAGMLFKYVTTVYDKKFSLTHYVGVFLKGKYRQLFLSKHCDLLEDSEVVVFCEILGLISLLLNRYPFLEFAYKKIDYLKQYLFSRNVAKYAVKNNVDAVVMWDSNVFGAFKYIHKHNSSIKCILDVSIASRSYIRKIFEKDIMLSGNSDIKKEQSFLWEENLSRYDEEFFDADYCLVASQFVENSILDLGVDKDKIIKLPYGVNISQFNNCNRYYNDVIKFLFVGQINRRKGLHHLLNVFSKIDNNKLELHVAGDGAWRPTLMKKYSNNLNIKFYGYVARNEIADLFKSAHIYIFPSLAEGMSLSGIEALASGLPAITTFNAGFSDLITNYKNGIIIDAYNEKSLYEAILWIDNNRNLLENMSLSAEKVAISYTWENYYANLDTIFKNIIFKIN